MATSNISPAGNPVPRRFRDYDVVRHAEARFECDRRPITKARAKVAVAEGRLEDNPIPDADGDEWRFRYPIDGLEVVVVCGGPMPHKNRYGNRIVTAFVDVVDATKAWVGTEWSKTDVHVAAALQYLNAGYHDADVGGIHPKQIDVYEPFEYGGHLLSWNTGHDDPFCHACRHESIDGDEWKRRPCPTR